MFKEKDEKLNIEELRKMNAFKCLWECNKNHLNDIAITYRADLNVDDRNKKCIVNKITYKELFNNIIKTVDSLKNAGVKRGDIVTYGTINTPEMVYTMYACIILGATFDPISPLDKSEDLLRHFESEPSKLFFTPEAMFENTKEVYGDLKVDKFVTMSFMESLPKIVQFGSQILNKKNGVKPFEAPNDKDFMNWKQFSANSQIDRTLDLNYYNKDDIISLAHTTGTTGVPKAVMHNNENWNAQYYNITHSGLKFVRGDKFFNITAPWVDFGYINSIHAFLCNGIRLDFDPTWTPEKNVDYYLKNRTPWWMGAPGWIDPLFTDEKYKDSDVSFGKYIITGGAPLFEHKHRLYDKKLKEEFNSNCTVAPGYGLTEVTAAAILNLDNNPGALGKPMPTITASIRDRETKEELPEGISGELWLTSTYPGLSTLTPGYLNNKEETDKAFTYDKYGRRWLRTGDKVHKNSNGTYTWESRYKNILTFNGFNINCDHLLDEVERIPEVNKGAVIGAVTSDGNQKPLICVEPDENLSMEEVANLKVKILDMIKEHFAFYYEPLDVIIYNKLPTKTMKLDITQLKKDNLNENGEYVLKLK